MLRLILMISSAGYALCQPLPTNWAGAGGAYNPSGSPAAAGWASYATLISQSAQLYSFTTHDITITSSKPYQIQTSVRSGVAAVVRKAGPLAILAIGDAGMAGAGSSAGGAFSGGGIGILQLGKTDWTLSVGVRVLKTTIGPNQNVYELGFGRVF